MRLDNVRFIRAEDFPEEMQQSAQNLANVLNPFMQQVFDLTNGRISFENTTEDIIKFGITVDATGKLVGNNQIRSGSVERLQGTQVINARNLSNPAIVPNAQPFIVFSQQATGLIQIAKITGLPAGRYEITAILY